MTIKSNTVAIEVDLEEDTTMEKIDIPQETESSMLLDRVPK